MCCRGKESSAAHHPTLLTGKNYSPPSAQDALRGSFLESFCHFLHPTFLLFGLDARRRSDNRFRNSDTVKPCADDTEDVQPSNASPKPSTSASSHPTSSSVKATTWPRKPFNQSSASTATAAANSS